VVGQGIHVMLIPSKLTISVLLWCMLPQNKAQVSMLPGSFQTHDSSGSLLPCLDIDWSGSMGLYLL
jgi:hypothetical protein